MLLIIMPTMIIEFYIIDGEKGIQPQLPTANQLAFTKEILGYLGSVAFINGGPPHYTAWPITVSIHCFSLSSHYLPHPHHDVYSFLLLLLVSEYLSFFFYCWLNPFCVLFSSLPHNSLCLLFKRSSIFTIIHFLDCYDLFLSFLIFYFFLYFFSSSKDCQLMLKKKSGKIFSYSHCYFSEIKLQKMQQKSCNIKRRATNEKKLTQLPAVDMRKLPGSCCCYSNHFPKMIQPSLDSHSLCILHSDCAKTSTYPNRWSLDECLAGACCMFNVTGFFFHHLFLMFLCFLIMSQNFFFLFGRSEMYLNQVFLFTFFSFLTVSLFPPPASQIFLLLLRFFLLKPRSSCVHGKPAIKTKLYHESHLRVKSNEEIKIRQLLAGGSNANKLNQPTRGPFLALPGKAINHVFSGKISETIWNFDIKRSRK
ncbi:hypothetical protein VP01_335g2 [Puccinia sorghi]|uniref:Uncharacterized protein n=1 Tax=Puccinia sorghi TaxID=27349 RepID=A0A0L6UWY0_9BASI|nr:hypothetical protein VP01_335g2 [Puccinia sorghi]